MIYVEKETSLSAFLGILHVRATPGLPVGACNMYYKPESYESEQQSQWLGDNF